MGQNLFLNTVIWFLKFFAPLSLPFPDTEVTSFLSNDLELLEFIVPDHCSIILLFLFPWKKSLEKCWKKIVTASKARCSTSLLLFFFPFLGKFFKENRYRRIIYIFFLAKVLETSIEYFSVHFFKIAKTLSKAKIENYRPPPSSKQIYLPSKIQLGIQ